MSDARIIYTETDEAPALATYSFLPMVQAFTSAAGVSVETRESRSDRFQYVPEIPAEIGYVSLGSVSEIVAKQSRWARHVRYGCQLSGFLSQ
jgi:hypothetical protein